MADPRCHVIVIPYPAQGHINPLLQFAKRLASKGVKATFATTPYTVNSIHAPNVGVEPISDGFDEGGFKQSSGVEAYLESFKTVGSRTLTELILKFNASGFPVTCIVYDSLLTWAVDVAKQLGIYAAVFLTNSASVCSMYWQIDQGLLTLPVKQETVPVSLPGLPSLDFYELPSFLASPTTHSAYLETILQKFHSLDKNDWVFCNSFEELEIETFQLNRLKKLRGFRSKQLAFPMGYQGFRKQAPVDFISSVGETGIVVAWCNQLEVLAHQAVGCFVTHCGWNSTLEGLSLGVPMVGVTQWSDQPTNAKFIEELWKVGVRAKKDEEGIVRRQELEKCIREVMVGERSEEMKNKASKWRDLAKAAVGLGGSSDTKINQFVLKLLDEKKA
ncbi:hypothetical protein GH714_040836 [Hevea brasiliensis]|uniref:Glycosyltransferase N-terminal domain-containing protein n=1 Tax=Hevea brasiliensis TaxID=3981 RepID=A0A6A6MQI5_HEVBR|nr:hypothetical protein GH714_040836 [Hevea brasiliensis]